MNEMTWVKLGLVVAALAMVGCNKAKEEALEGMKAVEAACKDDKAKGNELGNEWYGKNEAFKKAVDGAAGTWKIKDVSKFQYCGSPAFSEAKMRLENG